MALRDRFHRTPRAGATVSPAPTPAPAQPQSQPQSPQPYYPPQPPTGGPPYPPQPAPIQYVQQYPSQQHPYPQPPPWEQPSYPLTQQQPQPQPPTSTNGKVKTGKKSRLGTTIPIILVAITAVAGAALSVYTTTLEISVVESMKYVHYTLALMCGSILFLALKQ